ncbi:MAG: C1 family peptidase [Elainellaceae cyanobacterium]
MFDNTHGTGWIRDYPDHRDFQLSSAAIRPLLEQVMGSSVDLVASKQWQDVQLPGYVSLKDDFSPIEDQGKLETCTAHVVTAIAEYLYRRAFNEQTACSRLFLYKTTKNLLKTRGNVGVFLRTTIGALKLFGVPPEEYWSYDINKVDEEPPAFCYAFAANYKALKYVRLDTPDVQADNLLQAIKVQLAAGIPLAFGTVLFDGPILQARRPETAGQIPHPHSTDKPKGGHALVAVGYDDSMVIKNLKSNDIQTQGAILVRNSWGTSWGKEGYGWLPYSYIKSGLSVDWWALLSQDWVDTGMFGLNS